MFKIDVSQLEGMVLSRIMEVEQSRLATTCFTPRRAPVPRCRVVYEFWFGVLQRELSCPITPFETGIFVMPKFERETPVTYLARRYC